MESILLVLDTERDGSFSKAAFELISAAVHLRDTLGVPLSIGLFGAKIESAANMLAGVGSAKFYGVAGDEFEQSRYSTDALAIEQLCRRVSATIVLAPNSARLSRVLPGVACRLGGRIDTHVTAVNFVDGQLTVERWYYRQRMIAKLSRKKRPWFMVIESSVFEPCSLESGKIEIERIPVEVPAQLLRTKVVRVEAPAVAAQTLKPDAELLFVAGAGWTKKQSDGQIHAKEAEDLISSFLKNSKASLGSSKSLVDQKGEGQAVLSFMTHLNQVGQTGSTPRHPKGLATCCHGEEPHAVGWRFINERRAINLDPNCGWAQGKADVLYLADAFKVIARLNQLLS